MELSHVTFALFAAFSAVRIVSYGPQIYSVASDRNGASAIAYSTWFIWVGANTATSLYAAVNLHDYYLALVSAIFAACCSAVIALTYVKRRTHGIVGDRPRPPREAPERPRHSKGVKTFVLGALSCALGLGAAAYIAICIHSQIGLTSTYQGKAAFPAISSVFGACVRGEP